MRSGKAENDGIVELEATFDGVEYSVESLEAREEKVRSDFWEKFRGVAGRIPFADDLVASYYCAMDPATPTRVRGMLLGALAYFILPTDGIPDFVLGFGFTDDAAILAGVVSLVAAHIKPEHRTAAAKALRKDSPDEGLDTED